jgi:hypothetical protein
MSRSFRLMVCGCPRSVAVVYGNEKCIRKSLLLKELLASCPALEFILIHLRFNGLFFI